MAALTTDRATLSRKPDFIEAPVAAATKIFGGSMVCANAAGFAVPAADVAGYVILGVASATVDNTAGANGALVVELRAGMIHRFAATSITQAMVGDIMFVVDDQTFDDVAGANNTKAGTLRKFISTTEGEIQVHAGLR